MSNKENAQKYKRQTASRYLPIDAAEMTSKIMEADFYSVSTKLDGHLYLLGYDGKDLELINHGGNSITDLPLLTEALDLLKANCKDVLLAGELYLYTEGKRTRSFDLAAALADKSPDIRFAAFDIISVDGAAVSLDVKALDEKLNALLAGGTYVHPVNSSVVESRKDMVALYEDRVVKSGNEGLVIRSDNGPIYKVKPLITLDAVILGYAEGGGSRAGMLKEVLVGLNTGPNEYLLLTKVGNGYTEDERKQLLTELATKKVDSSYIEASGSNVAFTMVAPTQVIEFSCLDVFAENSKGLIRKMEISFKDGSYTALGKQAMASVIAPVYVKMRTDKKADTEDTGLIQITKIVTLATGSAAKEILKNSEVIAREVYVKASKGMKMVRKFMLWKTNKEDSDEYPAFVYHYTDFSPGRAEMLKKEIKVSNSKKQIEDIFAAEVVANVKKGWEKV
jgi:hypothetical protein